MNTDLLIARLKKAALNNSLRTLESWCRVSHETIRRLVILPYTPNMTTNLFDKIDQGLKSNGF